MAYSKIRNYIRNNTLKGFKTKPVFSVSHIIFPAVLYLGVALGYGFFSGLFQPRLIRSPFAPILPFMLFIFPALLEEVVFRGMLIPLDTKYRGPKRILGFTLLSTILFVIWHPLNALTINPGGREWFLDMDFLLIVAALGATCGYTYIHSRSIRVPIAIHWLTVMVWVFFLGGRNLLLE
uniref:CAAX protease self-immunity n=1 Tax=Candidatus Kentrum sp. TUN TaxID=2126343 RepID=A0A451ATR4_9GAMM|nr:MAG: CAAX protease self-immunity [Candidatus Kentron sp. TUN]VFK63549.1 MAG: CAAX protease self-immunity [Candidatus Kentron sp. TUN]VFK69405.1 MAG: CAAX protease self-immunity [Candidatus Kentron sp. TUN]